LKGGEDMSNKVIHMVAFGLLVIGGLNWLIFGLFNWEIGNIFGGSSAIISKIIYILVGISAISTHKANCKTCAMVSPELKRAA
jgi:uncharacterized membrane protein YuzA (DUF378 family)